MKEEIQKSMVNFIAQAKMIDGAENAIFELSEEIENFLILSGEIYGKETNEKINEFGRKNGFIILARDLSILYEKPKN
jgi:hypothetical protein